MGVGIEYSSTLEPRLVSNALVNEKLSTQVINKTEQSVATQIHSRGCDRYKYSTSGHPVPNRGSLGKRRKLGFP